ncbi:hypothetical protein P6F26_05670 [Roseibacterium sp. SDUM158017]|uniref:hypothetical protein n=1 Tax=Roseicyclus salinarum TaxID=3036773 RepID=UPI0024153291|nr:hypothetical protein [Roseibacterium sp. SDUM158017]MDG4647925.1 hypothetical protein [Roseibacterium sp. SDUM158017]
MPDHIERATSKTRTAAVAIQALAPIMAAQSDHPNEADAVRQLAVQIEDTLRGATEAAPRPAAA